MNVYRSDSFFKMLFCTANCTIWVKSSLEGLKLFTRISFFFFKSFLKFQFFSRSFFISLLMFLALSSSVSLVRRDNLTLLLAFVSFVLLVLDLKRRELFNSFWQFAHRSDLPVFLVITRHWPEERTVSLIILPVMGWGIAHWESTMKLQVVVESLSLA